MTQNGEATKRIFLWSNPRSISTAFEKMMSFVDGCQLWHEPYIVPYFNSILTNPDNLAKFPRMMNVGRQLMEIRAEIDAANGNHLYDGGTLKPVTEFSYSNVQNLLDEPLSNGKKFVFVKDMGMAIDNHYEYLPEKTNWRHTFLIRNPRRLALSGKTLLRQFYEYGDEDFDMMQNQPFVEWDNLHADPLFRLYNYVKKNFEADPIVIDADDLTNYPKQILQKYFAALGLQFTEKYLSWESSIDFIRKAYGCQDLVAWGVQQKAYDRAFYSSEFIAPKSSAPKWRDLSNDMMQYASEFEDGYRVMFDNRIRPL